MVSLHPFKTVDKLYSLLKDNSQKPLGSTYAYEKKLESYFNSAESTKKWSAALMQKCGETALHLMVMNPYAYYAIRLAVNNAADPDARNKNGKTPLDLALDDRRLRATMFMLEAGADIDPTTSLSWPKLIHLMLNNADSGIVSAMYNRGADFDHPFIWQSIAENKYYMPCAHKLVSYGAKPKNVVIDGRSAYRFALEMKNAEMAKMIIQQGTALHNPDEWKIIAETPELSSCAETLIAAGAKLENIVYENGDTPLHLAIRAHNLPLAKYLSKVTGTTTEHNKTQETPLHLAIQSGNIDLVKSLKNSIDDLEAIDANGRTPIQLAKSVYADASALDQVITHLERDVPKKEPEHNPWIMLDKTQIAHVQEHPMLDKKFTQIFNFALRERMTVIDDFAIKTSTCVITPFDNIDQKTLSDAFNAYQAGDGVILREEALAGTSGAFGRKDFGMGEKPCNG